MTDETLRQLLARVHERLSSSNAVDPEAREMLATVMADIDGALGKGGARAFDAALSPGAAAPAGTTVPAGITAPTGSAAPAGITAPAGGATPLAGTTTMPDSLSAVPVSPEARVSATAPRIEELAVRFEAEHPAIAQLLRQIGTLLGQAGI